MTKIKVNTKLDGLKAKSPELKKAAVRYTADELLKKCDVYIPHDTGMMRDSGIAHSVPEEGRLIWKTPYVKYQWQHGKSKGLRGRQWALRAWADHGRLIVKNAGKVAKGKV